jgi:hypothetical protein
MAVTKTNHLVFTPRILTVLPIDLVSYFLSMNVAPTNVRGFIGNPRDLEIAASTVLLGIFD